ncbi:integral membrane protein (macronuclear) [Tetrahymena thermophila SB210]|uniref:Integral membrane protein n=1 Tax=Tetrahymena thermophila (strain SB210) TaxID=312017 RepID=Q22DU5_TETTS|nr:integral membrane protein [Tetrahymena thermophila SB210]EAR83460.3 integral membrane protein [Tetrahymena thermophila SB210]|eukprot:XP_001031123.3 integral membrane protein [Tetrahymena thermophila SB210]
MSIKSLQKVRQAYYEGNYEEVKNVHRVDSINRDNFISRQDYYEFNYLTNHKEQHNTSGAFIKSAVYGGLDGLITTYAVVMGVAGAELQTVVILALGVSSLIGDGICMSLGDYLSTKSEIEFQRRERHREEWEVDNLPEEEKAEMIELYENKGISREDATQIVEIMSKYKQAWVDIMMVEELGLIPQEENPIKNAIVTLTSFILFGQIPLIPFVITQIFSIDANELFFYLSTGLTALFLFVLGYIKSQFTFSKWWKSGLETLFTGIMAAGSAYLIGLAFRQFTS